MEGSAVDARSGRGRNGALYGISIADIFDMRPMCLIWLGFKSSILLPFHMPDDVDPVLRVRQSHLINCDKALSAVQRLCP